MSLGRIGGVMSSSSSKLGLGVARALDDTKRVLERDNVPVRHADDLTNSDTSA